MTLIVDASVALKWVLEEPDTPAAMAVTAEDVLAAPEFLLLECANVLAIKVRTGLTTPHHATFSLNAIRDAMGRLAPAAPHLAAAMTIASDLRQSAYDSLYLALAIAEGAVLVTADARFARAAQAAPAYAPHIRLL